MTSPAPESSPGALVRALTAACVVLLASAFSVGVGAVTAMAGRSVYVLGLYDVVAALSISIGLVFLAHLTRLRHRAALLGLAVLAALLWLGAQRVVDAWAFRLEQGQEVQAHAAELAPDMIAVHAAAPLDLVDAGLEAETGAPGLRGALRVGLRSGLVVSRAFGVSRILPAPSWLVALSIALEAAFVALMIARALQHLAQEPVCAQCGRFLRRTLMGPIDATEAARLATEWARGERVVPVVARLPGIAVAYQDACPAGHSAQPGYAILRVRRRSLRRSVPGPLADLPPALGARPSSPA